MSTSDRPLDDAAPDVNDPDAGALDRAAAPTEAEAAAPDTDDPASGVALRPRPTADAPPTPGPTSVETLTAPDGTVLRLVPVTSEPLWSLARAIRQRVFVEEQQCPPAEEWDVYDEWDAPGAARHVVLFAGGSPAATARWRLVRTDGGGEAAKLERIAVLPAHRGKGLARVLVGSLVEAAETAGVARMRLSAQVHLERFYASFGFRRSGDDFWEAGIRHVPMARGDA